MTGKVSAWRASTKKKQRQQQKLVGVLMPCPTIASFRL
jgi:hypothetical protein